MPIPVSADKISAAMDRFDRELRGNSQWANCESNQAHRYAIRKGDKLYPVKQVIAMATGELPQVNLAEAVKQMII